jgi:hypothetical protein
MANQRTPGQDEGEPNEPGRPYTGPEFTDRQLYDREPQEPVAKSSLSADDLLRTSWTGAFNLAGSDTLALLVGGALAYLASAFTFGILAGPLAWGMFSMCLRRMRLDDPMRIEHVFSKFQRAGTSIGIFFLSGLLVVVGLALLVIPGIYAAIVLMYALPIGFDRNLGVIDSLKQSRKHVHQTGFWAHAVLWLSLVIPGFLLANILYGVPGILWYPIALAAVAVAYERYIRPQTAHG